MRRERPSSMKMPAWRTIPIIRGVKRGSFFSESNRGGIEAVWEVFVDARNMIFQDPQKTRTRKSYTKMLKKPISIRIDPDTIEYFKKLALETGIPYQNLMNQYLADCASKGLCQSLVWQKRGA